MANRGTVLAPTNAPYVTTPPVLDAWTANPPPTVNWPFAMVQPAIPPTPLTQGQLWPRGNKT